jgi:hypothetical protein
MDDKYESRECPRCGELFSCTGDLNCWCLDIEIPEYVREYISRYYEGCLCLKCLNELKKTLKQEPS